MKILFLTLDTFSRTGGIQQFNRCFQLALGEWAQAHGGHITHCSLVDGDADVLPDYTPRQTVQFRGFTKNRLAFIAFFLRSASSFDLVIFGHINLTPLSLLSRKEGRQYWLMAHGVEVWEPLSFTRKKSLVKMDKVLAVSQFTARKFTEIHGYPDKKVALFPNCLDPYFAHAPVLLEAEWNKHWRLQTNKTYLLTLARLSPTEQSKGYDAVIRLLPKLATMYPDVAYLLAGKWEEAEYLRVRRLADSFGVGHRLLMPGFVKPGHLPALFNLADVFVMPSSKEGFGIVFLEAAWWGCAVVAGNAGGAPEALLEGALGTLVPAADDDALLKALQLAIEKSKTENKPIHFNRAKIEATFGFSAFKERLRVFLGG